MKNYAIESKRCNAFQFGVNLHNKIGNPWVAGQAYDLKVWISYWPKILEKYFRFLHVKKPQWSPFKGSKTMMIS
jgi:hypothetical protein